MIRIKYDKNIIKISGHANFNDYGKDIVCASVSSIIYTTINGILNINKDAIKYNDHEDITIEIISNDKITSILINNMFDLLNDLARQYPKNIIISKGE